jgi:hypothetical protein
MGPETPSDFSPCARRDGIISEDAVGGFLIYDILRNKAHRLNPTLSWIWQRCDGTNTIAGLAAAFEDEFGFPNGGELVLDGLRQLKICELLDEFMLAGAETSVRAEVTRRSLMDSGTVLWPAVVSIVAPPVVNAKSKLD